MVCWAVCGMMLTPKLAPSTSFTVSDTPLTAMLPLGATKRAKRRGSSNSQRVEPFSGVAESTFASPSTWPETICPPSSSPRRSEPSRLIRFRRASFPASSATASRPKPPPRTSPAPFHHRQAAAGTGNRGTELLLGPTPASFSGVAMTKRASLRHCRSALPSRTVPIPVINPVNIKTPFGRLLSQSSPQRSLATGTKRGMAARLGDTKPLRRRPAIAADDPRAHGTRRACRPDWHAAARPQACRRPRRESASARPRRAF